MKAKTIWNKFQHHTGKPCFPDKLYMVTAVYNPPWIGNEQELIAGLMIAVFIIVIVLRLYPKKPTTDISGTVTEPDGTPAVAAIVTLMPDNVSATCDANGNFKIVSSTIDGSTGVLSAVDAKGNKASAEVLLDGNSHVVALGLVSISCYWWDTEKIPRADWICERPRTIL